MNKKLPSLFIILSAVALLLMAVAAVSADGTLGPQTAWAGNYCVAHGGVNLDEGGPQSFSVNVQGTPVAAYMYWSGRYLGAGNGDNQISANFGSGAITVTAGASDLAYAGYDSRYYYTYRSGDLSASIPGPGLVSVTVNGLKADEAHGAGLVVVSEGDECESGRVQLNFGLDGFYWNFPPTAGPDTQVTCVNFGPDTVSRSMDVQMFVGGVAAPERGNRIWYVADSGAPPTDIVALGNAANLLAGPIPPSVAPPFPLGTTGEWDDYATTITIPPGATFACFQIESIDNTDPRGASAVLLELMTRLPVRPTAVSLEGFAAAAHGSGLPLSLSALLLGIFSLGVIRRR